METNPFSEEQRKEGGALLKSGKVGEVVFSEGTYQVEVADARGKKKYYPFLQIDDTGRVLDKLCGCEEAEKKGTCVHLAAAFEKIFQGFSAPLHVRFRNSLWNHLCGLASRRHGDEIQVLRKKNQAYEAQSSTGKKLFTVKGTTAQGKKRLEKLLFKRELETEETSLKFSNLSPEEIALWKEGRPTPHLQYELSFWADLAKWMMGMQEAGEKYKIHFEGEKQLPQWIYIAFPQVSFSFYIAEANWPQLVPALSTVDSPLPVHEFSGGKIKAIRYEEKRKELLIERSLEDSSLEQIEEPAKGIAVGQWRFVPEQGFFPKDVDPIFKQDVIPEAQIGTALQRHPLLMQKYLRGVKIHLIPTAAQYEIHFDAEKNLHIACYVFEKGDLQREDSAFFGPWVFVQGKGFYVLEDWLFDGVEKQILRAQMTDFINRHRAWLSGFEGFQTHVSTIESNLSFHVDKAGNLHFASTVALSEEEGDYTDFGEWLYLPGKGFFAKRIGRSGTQIQPGTSLPKEQVSAFIHGHREELETLPQFFASQCPLEKGGLEIFLNEARKIVVRPHFQFLPGYDTSRVQIFGDYTYVAGEGFCEIPYEKRVPEAYTREKTIASSDETYFVLYELATLNPWILSIQRELKKPKELSLKILRLQKSKKAKAEWLVEGEFETEWGTTHLFDLWQAIQENRRYLFSSAGLLILKHPRFQWLKGLPKKRWLKGGKVLRLTTLEWLRLTVFEDLRAPPAGTPEENKTRHFMAQLTSFQTEQPIDLSGFKSDLRTYQEFGVRWLWFLYLHGLSGMLCDEMGLGKTHQAMGLIAAVKNQGIGGKVLVVCPTSVIYHWEGLLKNFLPEIRVRIFYGINRSLTFFEENADLLLTTYGTLRSEREALAEIPFEIAIFDELQIAKNAKSRTHKALTKIKASMRLGLTGTPIENRLLELKALFDVIVPGYLPPEAQFKEFFVNPIEKNQDEEKKVLLAKLIKPFILRRKKSEVLLELPEKIEEISYCDLSEEQKELYKKTFFLHKEALFSELSNETKPVPYLHVFSLLSSLKQICDHPSLLAKDPASYKSHSSGKWDLFVELLQEVRDSGQKCVIFSQYLDMLDIIEAHLKELGIGYASIRGITRNRKEELDRFREDPACEVFVASLQAVGVGVDLVSASVVIHYDRWWNPAKENQATDRVHRIGQSRGVQVFKLVTKGTIEEHIHQLIEKKLTLMEGVIGFDEHDQIKGLDRQELLKLLFLINKDIEEEPV